jgi:hypothetical protein
VLVGVGVPVGVAVGGVVGDGVGVNVGVAVSVAVGATVRDGVTIGVGTGVEGDGPGNNMAIARIATVRTVIAPITSGTIGSAGGGDGTGGGGGWVEGGGGGGRIRFRLWRVTAAPAWSPSILRIRSALISAARAMPASPRQRARVPSWCKVQA